MADSARSPENRQRALDAAIGQIERAFGEGSVMRLGQREQVLCSAERRFGAAVG